MEIRSRNIYFFKFSVDVSSGNICYVFVYQKCMLLFFFFVVEVSSRNVWNISLEKCYWERKCTQWSCCNNRYTSVMIAASIFQPTLFSLVIKHDFHARSPVLLCSLYVDTLIRSFLTQQESVGKIVPILRVNAHTRPGLRGSTWDGILGRSLLTLIRVTFSPSTLPWVPASTCASVTYRYGDG